MSVPAAYLAVILIWSTTPLAVKWSGEGPGFLFGALGRMALGVCVGLAVLGALRQPLPWHREARQTYLAATLGVYGALLCVYWGAQQVPSGIVAILFGLTPILTSVFARVLLDERGFTPAKVGGMWLGLAGLMVIFGGGLNLGPRASAGIEVLLLGVGLHSLSTVLIKRSNASLSGITAATGTLLLTTPLFFFTWLVFDGARPLALPPHSVASIVYLGVVGSVAGFSLYFYVLRHVTAGAAALVTLVSPVLALVLGSTVNHERLGPEIWFGATLVFGGLAMHQWGAVLGVFSRRPSTPASAAMLPDVGGFGAGQIPSQSHNKKETQSETHP